MKQKILITCVTVFILFLFLSVIVNYKYEVSSTHYIITKNNINTLSNYRDEYNSMLQEIMSDGIMTNYEYEKLKRLLNSLQEKEAKEELMKHIEE